MNPPKTKGLLRAISSDVVVDDWLSVPAINDDELRSLEVYLHAEIDGLFNDRLIGDAAARDDKPIRRKKR